MDHTSQKNAQSFEGIYNQFYIPVYRYLMKRLCSKEVCEDLTSDVFYLCYKNFDKYDAAKASIATWIYSVANNRLKNYYRDKKDTESIDDLEIPYHPHNESDMDTAVYLTQMKEYIDKALASVSERERAIVKMRYFSELTSEEIAEEVGTSAGNVRVILTRTVKKLAAYFEENGIRWE